MCRIEKTRAKWNKLDAEWLCVANGHKYEQNVSRKLWCSREQLRFGSWESGFISLLLSSPVSYSICCVTSVSCFSDVIVFTRRLDFPSSTFLHLSHPISELFASCCERITASLHAYFLSWWNFVHDILNKSNSDMSQQMWSCTFLLSPSHTIGSINLLFYFCVRAV